MKFLQTFIHNIQQSYYLRIRQQKSAVFAMQIPRKHYIMLLSLFSLLCLWNLYTKYQTFLDMKQGREFEATIILHYAKKENSERFKLQDKEGTIFYANYKGKFKPLIGKKARVYGKIYRCSFLRFLKGCNIYHSSLSLIPHTDSKNVLRKFIAKQHNDILSANLYNALFLADYVEKPIRQSAVALGLAHIIAISGFHLAVLCCMFYIVVCPFYFLLHRFFCYRNAVYDLGFMGLLFAFCYLVLIDFEPSFLRAFIMAFVAYCMLFLGLQITNFTHLFLCVVFALSWNVALLFHIGFLLSVCGVFCIFLFLQHIGILLKTPSRFKKIVFGILLFNCIIFLQMMPFSHAFFPYFSPYQLVSIPVSIGFVVFFPLVIIAHIFGFGALFDSIILRIVAHNFFLSEFYTPFWFLLVYIALCLLAMRFLWAYIASIACALVFYGLNLFFYLA